MTELESLFAEMAELTLPECRKCRVPLSCCSPEYCDMARDYAKEQYNIDLVPTGHNSKLPFMGEAGCTVPPHLRPLCTLHTCKINSLGTSGDIVWDNRYFDIREKIENAIPDSTSL